MATGMRIVQIAPLTEAAPPKPSDAPSVSFRGSLKPLVEQGHDVTLFASGNSVTPAEL